MTIDRLPLSRRLLPVAQASVNPEIANPPISLPDTRFGGGFYGRHRPEIPPFVPSQVAP